MKIIQNFSSKKHVNDFPIVDILIWYVGLLKLKSFGYTIKLYCEKKDYDFLKQWGLYDLYDEIDDTFMSSNELINSEIINGTYFWSKRKIECLNHEFEIYKEPFVYMDTDIVLNAGFINLSMLDLIVWSPEQQEKIYIPWTHLSVPRDYKMPTYIFNTQGAYNCGVLYFKTRQHFLDYRKQYLKYTMYNKCSTAGIEANPETIRNIWACNAEQRILKAIAEYKHWKVGNIMSEQAVGVCDVGIHYYFCRGMWRLLNKPIEESQFTQEQVDFWINVLNEQVGQLLHILNIFDKKGFEIFMQIDWLKDFYEKGQKIEKYK